MKTQFLHTNAIVWYNRGTYGFKNVRARIVSIDGNAVTCQVFYPGRSNRPAIETANPSQLKPIS
jgi:hypothetical protein